MNASTDDIFNGLGVEVELQEADDFLKVKETLTRIGIASKKDKRLYQSCHILHKRGRYSIMHFKELFMLDGKSSDIDDEDIHRRDVIASLLSKWKLLKITGELNPDSLENPINIKVLPFSEKSNWTLESKYSVGGRKTSSYAPKEN